MSFTPGATGHLHAASSSRPGRWVAAAVGAALMGLVSGAQAQLSSLASAKVFSLGLAATATQWQVDCIGSTACDRQDSGWRLTGAWQFAPQGALELVAAEQGRIRAEALGSTGLKTSDLRVRGAGVNVAWLMPLDADWLFTARVGALANRVRFIENAGVGATDESTSRTRTDPAVGLGLSWRLSPNLSLDGRYDWTSTRLAPPSASLLGGGSAGSHQWGLGLTGYF